MNRKHYLMINYLLTTKEGLTKEEIFERLVKDGQKAPGERGFRADLKHIKDQTGISIKSIDCHKNVWRYIVDRDKQIFRERAVVVSNVVANYLENEVLTKYKDLGSRIQTVVIPRGNEYLKAIAEAMRGSLKLLVSYKKFSDEEPYDAVLHPYCLKADKERWYLLAVKEGSEHPVQTFALDRIKSVQLSDERFELNPAIDVDNYFHDAFGIWVDPVTYPVRDIVIGASKKVADYLRTLPLHHSQHELNEEEKVAYCIEHDLEAETRNMKLFRYHISPTPDFLGELAKWGNGIKII